jgi:hypothetical protein
MLSVDRLKIPNRYVVLVRRRGNRGWSWQILRTAKPLGVKLYEDNSPSEHAAKLAGKTALNAILEGVTDETPNA